MTEAEARRTAIEAERTVRLAMDPHESLMLLRVLHAMEGVTHNDMLRREVKALADRLAGLRLADEDARADVDRLFYDKLDKELF